MLGRGGLATSLVAPAFTCQPRPNEPPRRRRPRPGARRAAPDIRAACPRPAAGRSLASLPTGSPPATIVLSAPGSVRWPPSESGTDFPNGTRQPMDNKRIFLKRQKAPADFGGFALMPDNQPERQAGVKRSGRFNRAGSGGPGQRRPRRQPWSGGPVHPTLGVSSVGIKPLDPTSRPQRLRRSEERWPDRCKGFRRRAWRSRTLG